MPKKILVVICMFLIICVAHLKGYCSTVTVDNLNNSDVYVFMQKKEEIAWNFLLNKQIEIAKNNNNTFNNSFIEFLTYIMDGNGRHVWFVWNDNPSDFFIRTDGQPVLDNHLGVIYCGCTALDYESNRQETYVHNNPSYNTTSNSSRTMLAYKYTVPGSMYLSYSVNSGSWKYAYNVYCTIPYGLEQYIPEYLYDTLRQIRDGNFNFQSTDTILLSIDEHIAQVQNELQNMNDFFQDDTTSQYTQNDLPSDTMNDITSDGFNNIFNTIRNTFTSDTSQNVDITIPYLDYTFSVNSFYIRNRLINAGFESIVDLFTLVWYASISLFIVKDIYKYINQIKNGDIGHTDTNIKADML